MRHGRNDENAIVKSAGTWINLATILIGIGINYGIFKSESAEMQRRISELEKENIAQVKWQTDKNSDAIEKLSADQKSTAVAISAIQAKIDVMATKVDFIAESVKRGSHN